MEPLDRQTSRAEVQKSVSECIENLIPADTGCSTGLTAGENSFYVTVNDGKILGKDGNDYAENTEESSDIKKFRKKQIPRR